MSDQTTAITTLMTELTSDALTTWSDQRRQDFTNTFSDRVKVARYLLICTAEVVREIALRKHFISPKHTSKLESMYNLKDTCYDRGTDYHSRVGGRSVSELDGIAKERADEIISKLPNLATAVRIISPEAAGWIEKRDRLIAKGKELFEASKEVAGPLDLDTLPETTTLATIRQLGKDREEKRQDFEIKMNRVGKEGRELDGKIDKFMYDGLPGLSDAVIKLILEYRDRCIAFETMDRRVAEQVKFGDSEAALEMLRTFENDEAKISTEIKTQFDAALETLKLVAAKGRKTATKKLKSSNG